jgi:two-component system cell cycle response regulator CtrA
MKLRDEYVQMLETENEELREKVRSLEETMGLRLDAPLIFQLTSHESRMFGALLKCELLTRQHAMNALYACRVDAEPEIKIIDVFICKLRKKLKPYEIEVETVRGRGYRMPAQSKTTARALLDQARAA